MIEKDLTVKELFDICKLLRLTIKRIGVLRDRGKRENLGDILDSEAEKMRDSIDYDRITKYTREFIYKQNKNNELLGMSIESNPMLYYDKAFKLVYDTLNTVIGIINDLEKGIKNANKGANNFRIYERILQFIKKW